MSRKNELFNTPSVKVSWANIADPDEYRGTIKHQIQIIADADTQKILDTAAGGSNIALGVPLVSVANKNVGFIAGSSSTTQYVCMAGYKGP